MSSTDANTGEPIDQDGAASAANIPGKETETAGARDAKGDGVQRSAGGSGDEWLRSLERFGEKPGLARIQFLLDKLGRPHDGLPVVHVAGTNGKGSTAAIVAAILRAAGLRVGLFTSPHLIRYNERIVVDGEPIADGELAPLLDAVAPFVEEAAARRDVGQPTEFEVATAVALAHFAARHVDVAVVEVGLGGRFDSTNVVQPVVSVITPIGLDHTKVLGTTLAHIAAEKAGILRPGVPVVMGKQPTEAAAVLRERAKEVGAPLYEAGRDFGEASVETDAAGTTFELWFGRAPGGEAYGREEGLHHAAPPLFAGGAPACVEGLRMPLVGAHQAGNAAVAAAAGALTLWGLSRAGSRASRGRGGTSMDGLATAARDGGGLNILSALRHGVERVSWPGRFETIGIRPRVIVDGAHNGESARVLSTTLTTVWPHRPIVFVIGMLAEKPVEGILEPLLPLAEAVVFTRPSHGRTPPAEPADLAAAAAAWRRDKGADNGLTRVPCVEVEPDPAKAMGRAKRLAGEDGVVVVCGSLYLVGEIKFLVNSPSL